MKTALTHRRLAAGMGLASLLAFAGGAGASLLPVALAGAALSLSLFWQPSPRLSGLLEKVWLPLALLLVARALLHMVLPGGDVVVPVVDLLLLLLCAESLRSLDAVNDVRLYALSFALILAATAYRPGVLFAAGFTAYIILGILALTVGQLRRVARTHGVDRVPIDGSFLLRTAGLAVPVLLVGGLVFVVFPRSSVGWNGRGEVMATAIAGFADGVDLGQHGSTLRANPAVVLRVEFPDGAPDRIWDLRWRGRSYDHFDGVRWRRSRGLRPSAGPREWYRAWGDSLQTQTIYAAPLDVRVLFSLHPMVEVESRSGVHPIPDVVGDFGYWGRGEPVYQVTSVVSRPSPSALRSSSGGYMPDRAYLQLPELPDRVAALADSITRRATTRYDRAAALERWLSSELGYTRDLPARPARATLDAFLFERRRGHCEYFASAMVVMLRSLGIHARIVNGFLGGEWSGVADYLVVTQNDAHSWVEVWFPGYGWVPFDPTPAAAGVTSSTADFWPGRFLFDALQHRWSRWVLDYDSDEQAGMVARMGGEMRERAAGWWESANAPLERLVGGVLLLTGLGALAFMLGRRDARTPETRLYLRLVSACRRQGLLPSRGLAPQALVEHLRTVGHPASGPAARLVDRYLRIRFGNEALDVQAQRDMQAALSAARRLLKRR